MAVREVVNETTGETAFYDTASGRFVEREAPEPSAPPPSFLGRVGRGFQGVGRGVIEGGKSTLAGLAALPGVVAGTPRQVWEDIAATWRDPAAAQIEQRDRMGRFARSLVPFSGSSRRLMAGESIGLEDLAREATEFGLSQRLPRLVTGAAKGATKAAMRRLPGASAELHELAIPEAVAAGRSVRPAPGALAAARKTLADMGDPTLAMENTRTAALRILAEEQRLTNPDRAFMNELESYLSGTTEGWSFETLRANAVDLGQRIGALAVSKGTKLGQWRELFEAIMEDAEAARPLTVKAPGRPARPPSTILDPSGQPMRSAEPAAAPVIEIEPATAETIAASDAWKQARWLARRDFAADELGRIVSDNISMVGDQLHSLNANGIVRRIERLQRESGMRDKTAKRFVESFRPGELNEIKGTILEVAKGLRALPSAAGAPRGSSQRFLHYAAGELIGGPIAGAGMIVGHEIITRAMMSPQGRAMVRAAVQIDPTVGPRFQNALAALVRSQVQEPAGAESR